MNNIRCNKLFLDVENNNIESVKCHIKNKENLNFFSIYNNYTVLFQAIVNNNIEMVKLLLENGANPNLRCMGNLPLQQAFYSDNIKIIKLLLLYGAKINKWILCRNYLQKYNELGKRKFRIWLEML